MFFETPKDFSRTFNMQQSHSHLFFSNNALTLKTQFGNLPCIDRFTRNFNQPLLSVGSHQTREKIILFPKSSALKAIFKKLSNDIKASHAFDEISLLLAIKRCTQKAFPYKKPQSFIKERIHSNQCSEQIISLNAFLLLQHGVCRHHALLNAYFLTRLKEKGLINGTIIHHRQDFNSKKSAHTWVLFISERGTLYSLDSMWGSVKAFQNPSELKALNDYYNEPSVSSIIEKRLIEQGLIIDNHFVCQVNAKRQHHYESRL